MVGSAEGGQRRIASYDHYRPADAGDIFELSPPFDPGTIADVISTHVSDVDESMFVVEIARLRIR